MLRRSPDGSLLHLTKCVIWLKTTSKTVKCDHILLTATPLSDSSVHWPGKWQADINFNNRVMLTGCFS